MVSKITSKVHLLSANCLSRWPEILIALSYLAFRLMINFEQSQWYVPGASCKEMGDAFGRRVLSVLIYVIGKLAFWDHMERSQTITFCPPLLVDPNETMN